MPTAHAALEIRNADLAHVWNAVTDLQRYPSTMPNVLEVAVIRRDDTRITSQWRTLLAGVEMTWNQCDHLEPYARITFEQLDGDLKELGGCWSLTETAAGVLVALWVTFDFGVPALAEVLNPIGLRAMTANTYDTLAGVQELVSTLDLAS